MLKKSDKDNIQKTDKGTYIIKMSDFYAGYNDNQEYAEVTEEVLTALSEMKRDEKRHEMRDYRHIAAVDFDENIVGEMYGHYVQSTEETYIRKQETEIKFAALKALDPTLQKRIYLYYIVGLTMDEIAVIEKVSRTAVFKSLKKAIEIAKKNLCDMYKNECE